MKHTMNFWNEAGDLTSPDLFACGDDLRRRVRRLCQYLKEQGAQDGDLLATLGYLRDEIGVPVWDTINEINSREVAEN